MAATELSRAHKLNKPLPIAMLDVDHFNPFNDEHGHDAGDTALRVLSGHLSDIDREGIYPARFGGEEFAIICANTSYDKAVEVVDALREKVAKAPIIYAGQRLPSLGFSARLAKAGTISDLRTLIACAHKALYAGKTAGRHQTRFFDDDEQETLSVPVMSSDRCRIVE